MQATTILLALSFVGVLYYLTPLLLGRDESSPRISSDSDDNPLIGACSDDREKKERLIENEVKHTPATNSGFIKKLIWIAIIAAVVFTFFYMSML